MGLSRSAKITLLLIIDVLFFFVELIVGYAVGSLALVADSFHMLNDVMSLIVALYAIKLTGQQSDHRYTYGWHRAEILAALINGVFLLALCFSISLEALERFFNTPEISNAKLVVIVGSLGLASNILGLFLFHEHGHSHSHDHSGKATPTPSATASVVEGFTPTTPTIASPPSPIDHRRPRPCRERSNSLASLYGHPAATRASLVQAANDIASQTRSTSPTRGHHNDAIGTTPDAHRSLDDVDDTSEGERTIMGPSETSPLLTEHDHYDHEPSTTASASGGHSHAHGHSHGSMNMRALLLHVLGDALGNVGVIATGLVIWLTEWKFKYYFDPMISLVITVIIFSSALPLVRSASFILLQGVPPTISLEEVRKEILNVPGVLSVHELHVWQLSEIKVVASVHITASRKHDFMTVAASIRERLHHHGIHSSTIQPEYYRERNAPPEEALKTAADSSCLITCPPDQACAPENACCPQTNATSDV
jgi:zinc transporter 1